MAVVSSHSAGTRATPSKPRAARTCVKVLLPGPSRPGWLPGRSRGPGASRLPGFRRRTARPTSSLSGPAARAHQRSTKQRSRSRTGIRSCACELSHACGPEMAVGLGGVSSPDAPDLGCVCLFVCAVVCLAPPLFFSLPPSVPPSLLPQGTVGHGTRYMLMSCLIVTLQYFI